MGIEMFDLGSKLKEALMDALGEDKTKLGNKLFDLTELEIEENKAMLKRGEELEMQKEALDLEQRALMLRKDRWWHDILSARNENGKNYTVHEGSIFERIKVRKEPPPPSE